MIPAEIDLSVIIVTWNSASEIETCVDAAVDRMRDENIDGEVIVVDNASKDATRQIVSNLKGPVTLIAQPENLGFARANNIGISAARGAYILILNPDTRIDELCLTRLFDAVKRLDRVGVIGCRLYNDCGTQRSYFWPHTLTRDVARLTGVAPVLRNVVWALSESSERRVGGVVGAFMFSPASVLREVGGFSDDIFLYGEDVDLCYRITSAGYNAYYLSTASCYHVHNASGTADQDRYAKHFGAIRHFYAVHQSRLRYLAFLCMLLATYPFRRLAFAAASQMKLSPSSRSTQERVYAQQAWNDLVGNHLRISRTLHRWLFAMACMLAIIVVIVLGPSWPVQTLSFVIGIAAYTAAVLIEPAIEKRRIDLLSPWIGFPAALATYYTVGLLLPLNYVGGRIPYSQAMYYVLAIGCYLGGVWASGSGLTLPRVSPLPKYAAHRVRARWVTALGLIASILMIDRFGARGADYGFRFAGAPGWTFYVLFMLVAGVFGLVLLRMWQFKGRWVTGGIVVLLFLTTAISLALGSRSPLFLAVFIGAITFHYVVEHFRPRQVVSLALVALLAITALGFARAMGDPSRVQWYTRNSIQYGVPDSAMLFAPGLLALRNGPGHLEVIREVYPDREPYMNGWFSVMSVATILPGSQRLPGHILTKTLFNRPIEEMGGVAPGMLGGFYVERGWLGIAIGMMIVGLSIGIAYRWMTSRQSALSVSVYSVLLANYLLWIYGNFLTNPIVIWLLILMLFVFWPVRSGDRTGLERTGKRCES